MSDRRARCRPARSRPGPGTFVVTEDLDAILPAGRRRAWAGWPSAARCRSATWATRPRPPRRSRSSTACGTRCPATGPATRRRRHRAARPRLGDDQLRRREDLRRGGRDRARVAPRGVRRRRRRPARASGGARRSSPSCSSRDGASADAERADRPRVRRHVARYKLPKAIVFLPGRSSAARGQGRLPLGPRAGDQRGHMSEACERIICT